MNNRGFCEGKVVNIQFGYIIAFKVNIDLRNFTGKAELDVGKFCPVAVRSLGCQIAVMPFTGSIGIFQTQLDAVVPFCLCVSTDGVFFVWFADVIQQSCGPCQPLLRSDTIIEEEPLCAWLSVMEMDSTPPLPVNGNDALLSSKSEL